MKSVVITGSSTGIGRACALGLDRAGWKVYAGVRRPEDAESLTAEASERLEAPILDVADGDTIAACADRVREATGGTLAALVNNAGITVQGPVEGVPLDEYRRQLEVNVIGQIAVTQAFLAMIRAARGRIVFVSSIGDAIGLPFLSPYNASKAAISAVADSLRQEMHPFAVEVSTIAPGAIATEIWDKGVSSAPALREQLGPEITALYGERLDKMETLAGKTGSGALPAEKVFEVVEHALTADKPKARYVVGLEAKIQATARTVLSKRAMDRLVNRRLEGA